MSLFSGLTRTLFMASFILLAACGREEKSSVVAVPESWRNMVKTDGQFYPVPAAWLSTPEGRIAHNLKLPDILPKPVPFDFEKAKEMVSENKTKRVSLMYFDHLCATEAGEWIFKKVENVEGLYFARPINQPTDQYLGDLYGPEAPWIERHFQLMGDGVSNSGGSLSILQHLVIDMLSSHAAMWNGKVIFRPPMFGSLAIRRRLCITLSAGRFLVHSGT